MVSIAAFQAVDPGSIPGRRRYSFSQINLYHDQNAQVCCDLIRTWVIAATMQGPKH